MTHCQIKGAYFKNGMEKCRSKSTAAKRSTRKQPQFTSWWIKMGPFYSSIGNCKRRFISTLLHCLKLISVFMKGRLRRLLLWCATNLDWEGHHFWNDDNTRIKPYLMMICIVVHSFSLVGQSHEHLFYT